MKILFLLCAALIAAVFWQQDHPIIRDKIEPLARDPISWVMGQLGGGKLEAAPAQPKYISAQLGTAEVRRTITATGTLNATVNIEVGSQLSGQVADVLADFNEPVTRGQPLARLDQRSFRARVDEAEAALEMARVAVETARARADRSDNDLKNAEAQSAVLVAKQEHAHIAVDAARSELKRREGLLARGVGAAVAIEEARNAYLSRQASMREAEAVLKAHDHSVAGARADLRRAGSDLEMAMATVPQREALLQINRIDLERTTIRSPIDGVVVGRLVNEGQTLATTMEAKTVFIIAGDLREMEIHARVDEADIGKIRAGQEAVFRVDAHPGRSFPAVVRQLRKAPQVQQNVVTYTVVLSAANADGLLLPGMTALVRITVSKTGPILTVPMAALRFAPEGKRGQIKAVEEVAKGKPASIWVLGPDGAPKPLLLGVGDDDGAQAAVLSGPLREGDRVLVGEAPRETSRGVFGVRMGL